MTPSPQMTRVVAPPAHAVDRTREPGELTRLALLVVVAFSLVGLIGNGLFHSASGIEVNGSAVSTGSVFAEQLVREFSKTPKVTRTTGSYSSRDGVVLSVAATDVPADSATQWLSDALVPLASDVPEEIAQQYAHVLLDVTGDQSFVRMIVVRLDQLQDPSKYTEALGTGAATDTSNSSSSKGAKIPAAAVSPVGGATSSEATETFDGPTANWSPLAGQWRVTDGEYQQQDNSGFDFISQNSVIPEQRFAASVKMRSIEGDLNAGLLLFQPTKGRRNGAMVVDLANAGSFIRWGHYDKGGPYVFEDAKRLSTPVDAKKGLTLQVTYADDLIRVFIDNRQVAQFTPQPTDGGQPRVGGVGLVTSSAKVAFDDFSISGI